MGIHLHRSDLTYLIELAKARRPIVLKLLNNKKISEQIAFNFNVIINDVCANPVQLSVENKKIIQYVLESGLFVPQTIYDVYNCLVAIVALQETEIGIALNLYKLLKQNLNFTSQNTGIIRKILSLFLSLKFWSGNYKEIYVEFVYWVNNLFPNDLNKIINEYQNIQEGLKETGLLACCYCFTRYKVDSRVNLRKDDIKYVVDHRAIAEFNSLFLTIKNIPKELLEEYISQNDHPALGYILHSIDSDNNTVDGRLSDWSIVAWLQSANHPDYLQKNDQTDLLLSFILSNCLLSADVTINLLIYMTGSPSHIRSNIFGQIQYKWQSDVFEHDVWLVQIFSDNRNFALPFYQLAVEKTSLDEIKKYQVSPSKFLSLLTFAEYDSPDDLFLIWEYLANHIDIIQNGMPREGKQDVLIKQILVEFSNALKSSFLDADFFKKIPPQKFFSKNEEIESRKLKRDYLARVLSFIGVNRIDQKPAAKSINVDFLVSSAQVVLFADPHIWVVYQYALELLTQIILDDLTEQTWNRVYDVYLNLTNRIGSLTDIDIKIRNQYIVLNDGRLSSRLQHLLNDNRPALVLLAIRLYAMKGDKNIKYSFSVQNLTHNLVRNHGFLKDFFVDILQSRDRTIKRNRSISLGGLVVVAIMALMLFMTKLFLPGPLSSNHVPTVSLTPSMMLTVTSNTQPAKIPTATPLVTITSLPVIVNTELVATSYTNSTIPATLSTPEEIAIQTVNWGNGILYLYVDWLLPTNKVRPRIYTVTDKKVSKSATWNNPNRTPDFGFDVRNKMLTQYENVAVFIVKDDDSGRDAEFYDFKRTGIPKLELTQPESKGPLLYLRCRRDTDEATNPEKEKWDICIAKGQQEPRERLGVFVTAENQTAQMLNINKPVYGTGHESILSFDFYKENIAFLIKDASQQLYMAPLDEISNNASLEVYSLDSLNQEDELLDLIILGDEFGVLAKDANSYKFYHYRMEDDNNVENMTRLVLKETYRLPKEMVSIWQMQWSQDYEQILFSGSSSHILPSQDSSGEQIYNCETGCLYLLHIKDGQLFLIDDLIFELKNEQKRLSESDLLFTIRGFFWDGIGGPDLSQSESLNPGE